MLSKFHIIKAVHIIKNNGVIAYPTESVYGLGCDPLSEWAVNKILQLKHRPVEKGLIIIAANISQLLPYIDICPQDIKEITDYASPMTWLVNKSKLTPVWISGEHHKVAIRISQHPDVISLCNKLGHPIVSTSANPAKLTPASNVIQARRYFSESIDLYLSGATGQLKKPTPITDLETRQVIRSSQ